MNNGIATTVVLGASIILEVVLELKGIRVPDVVLLLSGFAVRHIIGGDTAKDTPVPVLKPSSPIIAPTTTIPIEVKP